MVFSGMVRGKVLGVVDQDVCGTWIRLLETNDVYTSYFTRYLPNGIHTASELFLMFGNVHLERIASLKSVLKIILERYDTPGSVHRFMNSGSQTKPKVRISVPQQKHHYRHHLYTAYLSSYFYSHSHLQTRQSSSVLIQLKTLNSL